MKFDGVHQLGVLDMLSACDNTPSEGILYVFDNRMLVLIYDEETPEQPIFGGSSSFWIIW